MPKIVVIGGSAGSINVLKTIFRGLPADFPAAVLVVTHIGARESMLPSLLERHTALPVRHALQGEPIVPGQVLVAPSDLHLTVARDGERMHVHLSHGPKENHARPAIDPLFRTAASLYRADAIAVVVSGFLDDGTVGLQAIRACGGTALVQDPAEAEAPDMPASALRHAGADFVLRADEIAPKLLALAAAAAADPDAGAPPGPELQDWIAVENRMFTEGADMEDLDRIGTRVGLTCPECGGTIWQMRRPGPLRYRCHTGHAFTARVLESRQVDEVDEALWAAVRSLHEQEQLLRNMGQAMRKHGLASLAEGDADNEYLARADQARDHAQLLRELIEARMRVTPPR